ncbi:MAG: phosphoglucosamine mutase [Lachnospiraceae bacterium]|jgi:phosphoglucosamine mutase|nr:phosphoglucosamine mutase [Lachnospiraceae bacterium]
MGKYFGTDGFRGEANKVLTVDHAFKVGKYLGWYYGKEHKAKIVIGKDTRRSSYMFEYALAAGITSTGANAHLLHVTTTPSVSYITRTEDFDCGIMISASHNPYYDNGIKLINKKGHKMEAEVELAIEDYIDGKIGELPLSTGAEIGRTVDYYAGRNRYMGHLISLPTHSYENIKIGLDLANGSAFFIAKNVFDSLGADTYVINDRPDGVNINTDAGSTHINVLSEYVKANGLDVGFAYDGDADRCIAVDNLGNVIDGDLILYICGKYLKNHGKLPFDTVVTTIMSNIGLYKAFDKVGIRYEKTNVGDKYVYENMKENGYALGGEQSGHIIFSQYAKTGDGILTSLMIMEAMLSFKQPLSKLAEEVTIYPQLLKNVVVENKEEALSNEKVKEIIEEVAEDLGEEGRILVRESGTEPVIRIMVEAATSDTCEDYVNKVIEVMKNEGLLIEIR